MLLSRIALLPHGPAVLLPVLAGFLLPLQTVLILRPGTLGGLSRGASAAWGIPWPLATIGVYASDVVLFVAAVVGATRLWRGSDLPPTPPLQGGGKRKRFSPPLSEGEREGVARRARTASVLLIMLAAVNTFTSADPWLSAVGWLRIIAFLLALAGLSSWPTSVRRAFLGGFLVAMLGHVIVGLIQFFTLEAQPSTLLGIAAHHAWTLGDSVITAPGERWLRAYGGFPHPNVLGTALLVALVALVRRWSDHRKNENGGNPKSHDRDFLGFATIDMRTYFPTFAFCIFTFALVFSFSRSALLGLVVLLIMLTRRIETRRLAIAGALAVVAALIVTASFWIPRITGSTPNEQRSLSERSHSLEAAIAFGSAPPFLGVGLHAMPRALVERASRGPANAGPVDPYTTQPTHNVPLLVLAEVGLIGVAVFILIFVAPLRRACGLQLAACSSTAWLPLAPSLLFDHHLWSLPIGLALLFALAVAISRTEEQPLADSPSPA